MPNRKLQCIDSPECNSDSDSEGWISDFECSELDETSPMSQVRRYISLAVSVSAPFMTINWWHFKNLDCESGWGACKLIASHEHVFRWYVGVTKNPLERMETSPHMIVHKRKGYHVMYPIVFSSNAGKVEKLWIKLLTDSLGYARRGNNGDGGEHVKLKTFRFVYVCIRWQTIKPQSCN